MGKREQPQPPLQHKQSAGPAVHRFSAVITFVLAVALLVFGAVLPNWLLHRRSEKYFSTTAQISISDIHPYGDQYESIKQSLLNTIRYKSTLNGQEWTVGPDSGVNIMGDDDDEESNSVISETLSRFDDFLTAWNTALSDEDRWLTGLETMGYDNTVPISSQNDSRIDILMINATDYSNTNSALKASELLLDCSTGAPVYMHLALFSWDDPSPDLIWTCLLSAYRSQLGIQFTEVSSDHREAENSSAEESDVAENWFTALSADQVFCLDASIQMERGGAETDDSSVAYQIQVELYQMKNDNSVTS